MLKASVALEGNCIITVVEGSKVNLVSKNTKKYDTIPEDEIYQHMAYFYAFHGDCYVVPSPANIESFSFNDLEMELKVKEFPFNYGIKNYFYKFWEVENVGPKSAKAAQVFHVRNLFDIEPSSVTKDAALVSGGFFLLQPGEADTLHSWYGDPFSLLVLEYETYSYATFKRSCIIQDEEGTCFVDRFCCNDFEYGCGNHWFKPIEIYVRETSLSPVKIDTKKEFTNYVLLNGRVVEKTCSGKIECPVSGVIVKFNTDVDPGWEVGDKINLRLKRNGKKIKFAIQCGPTLIKNSNIVLQDTFFHEDNLTADSSKECLVPKVYSDGYRIGCDRPKVGMGFTRDNRILWLGLSPVESNTISLYDVAKELKQQGVVTAIALDGGGSARSYHDGKEIFGVSHKKRSLPYFLELT